MYALSIKQPWASLIALGVKHVENRTWGTYHDGPLLIHAAQRDDTRASIQPWELLARRMPLRKVERGALIGCVELRDVVHFDGIAEGGDYSWARQIATNEQFDNDFVTGPYCWLLDNPWYFEHPIYCKGQSRLWTPEDRHLEFVREQLPR